MASITIERSRYPLEYGELITHVYLDNEPICQIQMEEGAENLIIEFYGEPIETKIYYNDLVKALERGKEFLLEG